MLKCVHFMNNAIKMNVVTLVSKHKPMPASWNKAVGLAKKKKELLKKHVENVRKEWK